MVSLIIRFSLHPRNRETTSIVNFPEVLLIFLILLNWLKTDVTTLHLHATSDCSHSSVFPAPDRKRLCPGEDIFSLQAPASTPYWEPDEHLAHQVSFFFLPLSPLSIPFPTRSILSQGDSAFGRIIFVWSRQFHWYERGGANIKGRDHNTYLAVWCLFISLFLPLDYESLEGRNYVLVSLYLTQNKCPIHFKNYLLS